MTDLVKLAERCETEAGSRELDPSTWRISRAWQAYFATLAALRARAGKG